MVDIIEEPPYVKQEDPCFEASSMGALDVVQEGQSRVQARRVGATPKLVGVYELVRDDVVLHALRYRLLKELAHSFEQRDGPVRFGKGVSPACLVWE
jgi:hypothetical protein